MCVPVPTVASAGLNVISSVVGHRQPYYWLRCNCTPVYMNIKHVYMCTSTLNMCQRYTWAIWANVNLQCPMCILVASTSNLVFGANSLPTYLLHKCTTVRATTARDGETNAHLHAFQSVHSYLQVQKIICTMRKMRTNWQNESRAPSMTFCTRQGEGYIFGTKPELTIVLRYLGINN